MANPGDPVPGAAQARRILGLLEGDDVDAAIQAGLARFVPLPELDGAANARLAAARDRLLAAWAARERHRARARRLERIGEERRRARSARQATAAAPGAAGSQMHQALDPANGHPAASPGAGERLALPAAAAAALARARARASGGRP